MKEMAQATRHRGVGSVTASPVAADKPQHLLSVWGAVEQRLRQAGRVALFTDFDGTLVPIRQSPDAVRMSPAVGKLLEKIVQKGITVGLVSGREIANLRTSVGLLGIWYVGEHGYVVRRPDSHVEILLSPSQRARMGRARRQLTRQLRSVSGILLEPKEVSVAVHYRQASPRSRTLAWTVIRRLLEKYPDLHLLSGKKVWELLPGSRVSKWTAIQRILRFERGREQKRWLVFYLGDDSTDERVFEKMKGISVAVGKHQQTEARFFLRSSGEVRLFLQKLCETIG